MKHTKKLLAILMVVCMLVPMFGISVLAVDKMTKNVVGRQQPEPLSPARQKIPAHQDQRQKAEEQKGRKRHVQYRPGFW